MKFLYRPLGMLLGALGGFLATAIFGQVWKVVGHDEEAPSATMRNRTWREVLLAAALQGAIFGLVKAAIDRGGAKGFQKLTGKWPGDEED
ncbi:membrane protein [Lentzea aerocolonigenes]|jgi:hypothetical protein|uniref:Membrane protein n=1 Tax=Lentzea aerocolonigenes TaxID=68170 RepID=A0A0F0GE84_LENAE|nr:DUF4235 domain-containing protein [Lentzea aerocolonigenes]KJK38525.1 membrane protein [Lentzea aerocolonigenes]MDT7782153.1 hypothetical protein [Pseudonocardiales bacterium]